MAIIASTNKMWMKLPTACPKAKNPIAHPISRIMAMVEIKFLIASFLKFSCLNLVFFD